MFKAHMYGANGGSIVDIVDIREDDADYFTRNRIKVSIEQLNGEIIAYACPYDDEDEESEIIMFARSRSCEDTMHELAEEARLEFGDNQ